MDSQLASVLTSGSPEVQNGSRGTEGPGTVTEDVVDSQDRSFLRAAPGNLQPSPVQAAVTITRQDAPSVNGKKPEGGGSCQPASQDTRKIGGFREPITVKTGVPVLRSQPIRIRIVVPPRCKRPITNSAISLTKDFARTHFRRPVLVSSGAARNRSQIKRPAVETEGHLEEVTHQRAEEDEAESFHGTEAEWGNTMCKETEVSDAEVIHTDGSGTPPVSGTHALEMLSQRGIKEETADMETGLILKETDSESCGTSGEVAADEQTEPLDLSLPKKRESLQRRTLEDSGCETSLIMEVDEYEGDGDRDVVEEDDDDKEDEEDSVEHVAGTDTPGDPLLSPSFFSTSVFTSLDSVDRNTEHLLLIDDQGIPYTLSPGGLKVPQVDASTSDDPRSDQASSVEAEDEGGFSQLAPRSLSQSLDNALNAPSDTFPSLLPDAALPSLCADQAEAPQVLTSLIVNSDPAKVAETSVGAAQEASAVLPPPSGLPVPSQRIQILNNPSTNAPFLLLSSSSSSSAQLASVPVSLSLPLSVTQTSPGASTSVFLLLSPVPSSSSGDSASTSTPIAVLDPSTGQLSQIRTTAAAMPVSLPLSSGQVATLGSPLPALSHPVIRLSAGEPPVVLSGVDSVTSVSALRSLVAPSSTPALQTPALHPQTNSPESNPGSEAISAEEVSNETNKPSTVAESTPHPQSSTVTFDPFAQPSSEGEAQSPAPKSTYDPCGLQSEHLHLDDHLYFSNMAAPPSPPAGPSPPSGHLDPLDPLSPASSPSNMAARRVLYCQLCPRVFFYLSDLERHAITHSQKKPHVCQQCGKAFKRSSHLQRHKHIHTGQRNFVCPICAKRFREAGELQRHQRVHTGEKPYQCQLCHTRFAERNTLRRHTKRKHPYHQVAMEMLNERRDRGGGGHDCGVSGAQEEDGEESAEWYSSTVSNLDDSESELET